MWDWNKLFLAISIATAQSLAHLAHIHAFGARRPVLWRLLAVFLIEILNPSSLRARYQGRSIWADIRRVKKYFCMCWIKCVRRGIVREKTNKILPPPSARDRLLQCRGRKKGQTDGFASWRHNISRWSPSSSHILRMISPNEGAWFYEFFLIEF